MARLEHYKDFLIPVNEVVYAEYRKPNKNALAEDEMEGGTYIWVKLDAGMCKAVKIGKKNLLDDFQKWHKQFIDFSFKYDFNDIWQHGPICNPFIQEVPVKSDGSDLVPPAYCSTTTSSDGLTQTIVINGTVPKEEK